MSDLLTIAQAARRAGCSVASIYAAIADGRLAPYDSPNGERHLWAAEVDALTVTGRHHNSQSGEPMVTVAEVPGDDEAARRGFDGEELDFLNFCLSYTCARARLHIKQKPVSQRLLRRFHRIINQEES